VASDPDHGRGDRGHGRMAAGYNHLWDSPAGPRTLAEAVLYNISTVATLGLGVACMYGILYVLALAAALAVIDAGYLHARLAQPVGITTYATIVWLASSMAGATVTLPSDTTMTR
jgi:hypothetical protein